MPEEQSVIPVSTEGLTRVGTVLIARQREIDIYTFVLNGPQIAKLATIDHFGASSTGVQRRFDEERAMEMAQVMSTSPDLPWEEPIIVDLRGTWVVKDDAIWVGEDATMSVDDGQHRSAAIRLLTTTEQEALSFNVTGTKGLPYETRLRVFRMQTKRKAIDPRLDLAQRDRLKQWDNALDEEAYKLVLELSSSASSPLRGRVQIEEGPARAYETSGNGPINARGLYATIRTIIGRKSPLHSFLPTRRAEIVMMTVRAAAEVWKSSWGSDRHVLTTARGVNAVLILFVKGANFRGAVGETFTQESIKEALSRAPRFDWGTAKSRNQSVTQIAERIDQAIGKGTQDKMRNAG